MAPTPFVQPVFSSESTFKPGIFKGRVLFCTGGGSGICRVMTEAIMRHGADAAIVGRKLDRLTQSASELSRTTGRSCIATQADVRKPEALKDAVAQTIARFGRIDFVICGAAGNFLAPISGLSENAFRTVMEIDTIGTYNTIKSTIEHVRKSKGAYVHVSATFHYRGTPYQAHVSAAKAAVDALSRVLAVEEGPHGVRSNVIAPGGVGDTEGMAKLSLLHQEGGGRSMFPLGRIGHSDDIANAAVFLFSDAARYVTAQVLVVDGGQDISGSLVPYPSAVLDPERYKDMVRGKL